MKYLYRKIEFNFCNIFTSVNLYSDYNELRCFMNNKFWTKNIFLEFEIQPKLNQLEEDNVG